MRTLPTLLACASLVGGCATSAGATLGVSRSNRGVTRTSAELSGRLVSRSRSHAKTTNDARVLVLEGSPIIEYRSDGGVGGGFHWGLGGSLYEGPYGGTVMIGGGVLIDAPRDLMEHAVCGFFRSSVELQYEPGGGDWTLVAESHCSGRSQPSVRAPGSPHTSFGLIPSVSWLSSTGAGELGNYQPSEWVVGLAISVRRLWEPRCLGFGY